MALSGPRAPSGAELPGYDQSKHADYVALGYCPAVSPYKSYCCQPDGHGGPHHDVYMMADGNLRVGFEWD